MIEVFFSYAHEDETLRDELAKQLKLLERQGIISAWHDRKILAGSEWGDTIDAHLDSSKVILLLVSPDFLASDYCWDIEVKRSMERHEADDAIVIPIILRPVDWQEAPFGKLQALPHDAEPITKWENQDEAFMAVAQGIRSAINTLSEQEQSAKQLGKFDSQAPICGDDVYPNLLKLGYRQQARLFRRLIEVESVGAFLIHGYPDYGQRWLLNRLIVQYVNYALAGKKIVVNVSRKVRRNDVSAFWREIAGHVGLRGKLCSVSEIAERVYQQWRTQNVLLVFHEIERMPENAFSELIDKFWLPLIDNIQKQYSQESQKNDFKLLMFLLDYEGRVTDYEISFAERINAQWTSRLPVKSPILSEFSQDDLTDWLEDEYENLPTILTQRVDDTVQEILTNSEDGIPELVFGLICEQCGCNWYEERKKWLKL